MLEEFFLFMLANEKCVSFGDVVVNKKKMTKMLFIRDIGFHLHYSFLPATGNMKKRKIIFRCR